MRQMPRRSHEGRETRKPEHEGTPRKKRAKLLLAVFVMMVVAAGILLLGIQRPSQTLPPSHPTQCIEFDKPVATSDGHGGWWVSVNISISYTCYQSLQNSTCTNWNLTFVFTFSNGSKSPNIHYEMNLSDHPGPLFDFVSVYRAHWSTPEPPVIFEIVDRRCQG